MRDSTWQRRLITVPAVLVGFVVAVPGLVVGLPLAAAYDLVRRRPLPTARMLLFGLCYLGSEVVAIVGSFGLWLATGFGTLTGRRWSIRLHGRFQTWWVETLLTIADRLLDLRIDVDGAELLELDGAPRGPLVVLCRHASMVDTLIPARLLAAAGYDLRYVLKRELLWDPALDIFGHRMPNHFLDRSGSDAASELAALRRLAAGAGPRDAVVIFPEGTRLTPSKRARALERLATSDPDRAATYEKRTHTMPPRPRGTLALFDGAPAADVITLAHTGLEGLTGPAEALRLVPFRHPVRVSLWRTPRGEIPASEDERTRWLDDEWARVDEWVAEHEAT